MHHQQQNSSYFAWTTALRGLKPVRPPFVIPPACDFPSPATGQLPGRPNLSPDICMVVTDHGLRNSSRLSAPASPDATMHHTFPAP